MLTSHRHLISFLVYKRVYKRVHVCTNLHFIFLIGFIRLITVHILAIFTLHNFIVLFVLFLRTECHLHLYWVGNTRWVANYYVIWTNECFTENDWSKMRMERFQLATEHRLLLTEGSGMRTILVRVNISFFTKIHSQKTLVNVLMFWEEWHFQS